MIMKRSIILILLALGFFYSCKSKYRNDVVFFNKDDASIKSEKVSKRMAFRAIYNQNSEDKIKVLYKDSIYSYMDFKKSDNFSKAEKVFILEDSLNIAKYNIKNCDILYVVE